MIKDEIGTMVMVMVAVENPEGELEMWKGNSQRTYSNAINELTMSLVMIDELERKVD